MPAVAITRPAATGARGGHPKAVIVTEKGHKVVLPYAPEGGTLSGFGWNWTLQDRPDRKPLVTRGGRRLKVYSYTLSAADPDPEQSIEPFLTALRYIADLGERVTFTNMGPSTRGLYRFSLDSINPSRLQYGTNYITQCTVGITFTEAVDAVSHVGPLTGGAGGATGTGPAKVPLPAGLVVDPGLRTPNRS